MQAKQSKEIKEASRSYFIFEDDYDTDDESANAYASEFITHPDWDPEDTHYVADIAIAVLKKPMEISDKVQYVCLNTPSDPIQNLTERNGLVYGWGYTNEDYEIVTALRHVGVPLVDQGQCNSSSALSRIMSDTSFCAGTKDGKTGACNGIVLFIFIKFVTNAIKMNFFCRRLWRRNGLGS